MGVFIKELGSGISAGAKKIEKKILLKKIKDMDNLPSPSQNMMSLIRLFKEPELKISELIHAIEKDQSLVASILKLINSGYYAMRNSVDSVERAVNLLGIINVKQLVYSSSILNVFGKEQKVEWDHAYSSSILIQKFIKENNLKTADTMALAMLMHDVGKVVLQMLNPNKYKMARSLAAERDIPIFEAEEAIIYINHAEVAQFLLEKWDMEEHIINAIMSHHLDTVPKENITEVALVQLINWIDCNARSIVCKVPTEELLEKAGLGNVDKGYWVRAQRDLIAEIEREDG